MRELIKSFLVGIGFGAIIYVNCLYFMGVETQTPTNIGSVILVSGVIGLVSRIFTTDFLDFKWQLTIHFGVVFSLIVALNAYNNFTNYLFSPLFFGIFITAYLLVWVVLIYVTREKVSRINQKITEKK